MKLRTEQTERYYPLVGAAVVTLLYLLSKLWPGGYVISDSGTVMRMAVLFSSILIGFTSTSMSLLLGIPDRPFVNRLREANGFGLLIGYLLSSIKVALVLAALSAMYVAVGSQMPSLWSKALLTLWLFFVVFSGLSFYRAASLLAGLLKRVMQPPERKYG